MTKVVIGVDPHKRLNAVVVLDARGKVLARQSFANSAGGYRELKAFWRQWRPRRWAIEGCNGAGRHIAQRLVAEGEAVFDVSTEPTRSRHAAPAGPVLGAGVRQPCPRGGARRR